MAINEKREEVRQNGKHLQTIPKTGKLKNTGKHAFIKIEYSLK